MGCLLCEIASKPFLCCYVYEITKCQVKCSSPACYRRLSTLDGDVVWLHIRNSAKLRGSDKMNTYFKGGGGDLGKLNHKCLGDSVYFSVLHFPVLTKMSESLGIY